MVSHATLTAICNLISFLVTGKEAHFPYLERERGHQDYYYYLDILLLVLSGSFCVSAVHVNLRAPAKAASILTLWATPGNAN